MVIGLFSIHLHNVLHSFFIKKNFIFTVMSESAFYFK